jgi:mono/diheme cytochrome c family protein
MQGRGRAWGLAAATLFITLGSWGSSPPRSRVAQRSAPAAGKPSAQWEQGRQVFVQFCAACHGENGNGKPASGLALKPPALDLIAYELSEPLIERVLQEGVMGTGMAAWKSLPADQLSAVTVYTASLGRPDQLAERVRVAPDDVLQEAGRRVYVAHCARCHGSEGKGDGPEASRYKPPPATFSDMRPSYAAAARVVEEGVPGTAMPAWPLLTRGEVQAVTFYIRSLYRGPEPPKTGDPASKQP